MGWWMDGWMMLRAIEVVTFGSHQPVVWFHEKPWVAERLEEYGKGPKGLNGEKEKVQGAEEWGRQRTGCQRPTWTVWHSGVGVVSGKERSGSRGGDGYLMWIGVLEVLKSKEVWELSPGYWMENWHWTMYVLCNSKLGLKWCELMRFYSFSSNCSLGRFSYIKQNVGGGQDGGIRGP